MIVTKERVFTQIMKYFIRPVRMYEMRPLVLIIFTDMILLHLSVKANNATSLNKLYRKMVQ